MRKLVAIVIPNAKVLVRVQILTIVMNALTLKMENIASLNVRHQNMQRMEFV